MLDLEADDLACTQSRAIAEALGGCDREARS
jgi:hypothetical protein